MFTDGANFGGVVSRSVKIGEVETQAGNSKDVEKKGRLNTAKGRKKNLSNRYFWIKQNPKDIKAKSTEMRS